MTCQCRILHFCAIAIFAALGLSACASIEYHPHVGDEQILQGTGGALDEFDGVEFWVKGAPNKPYQVIGYIDGEFDDEWPAEDSLRSQISAKVKEIGGDGVVLNKRTTKWGGTYVINGVAYDGSDEIFDEYTVFRYVR